jgi:hypothetical protein
MRQQRSFIGKIRAGAVTTCQRKKIANLSSDQLGRHGTYGNSFLIALNGEVIRQDGEASMS